MGLAQRSTTDGQTAPGLVCEQVKIMLFLIKPDAATHHAQFVLLIYCLLTTKLGQPVRKQQMLRYLGIATCIKPEKIGWQRCVPPLEK